MIKRIKPTGEIITSPEGCECLVENNICSYTPKHIPCNFETNCPWKIVSCTKCQHGPACGTMRGISCAAGNGYLLFEFKVKTIIMQSIITWHKWPDEKPSKEDYYLCLWYESKTKKPSFSEVCWLKSGPRNCGQLLVVHEDKTVIATIRNKNFRLVII